MVDGQKWLHRVLIGGLNLLWASTVIAQNLPSWMSAEEKIYASLYNRTAPAVVNISNIKYQRRSFFLDLSTEVPSGAGSGFLWDDKGHIITNYHVIQGAESGQGKLVVSFRNGETSPAQVVGVEPRKDIAVLRVKVPSEVAAEPIPLADSSKLMVGQFAIAIGSPFGLEQSLTRGVVSALGRAIPGIGGPTIRDVIQSDTAVNPGNSGGPLLDSRGYLIGMNTAIYSKSGSSAGISFAVPSNTIKRVVSQLIRFGRVKQPGLGVSVFKDEIAAAVGVSGVIVWEVQKGSGADLSGMKGTNRKANGEIDWGDVVIKIDQHAITSYDDLYNTLEKYEIGQEVDVQVLRKGRMVKHRVRLSEVGQMQ